jgi:DnaJ like chaperone protein
MLWGWLCHSWWLSPPHWPPEKAYRRMAMKYHPDKVVHLGEDFRRSADEKFKKVNEAYGKIKKERNIA